MARHWTLFASEVWNGNNNCTFCIGLLKRWNEVKHVKCLEPSLEYHEQSQSWSLSQQQGSQEKTHSQGWEHCEFISNMLSLRHLWKQRKRSGPERCRFHFRAITNRDDNGSYGNGWACPESVGKVRTDKSHRANPGDVNIEVSIFRKRGQGRKHRKAEKSEGSL